MQYPYLTLLEIVTVLLTLLIGLVIFYFLVKRWRETKFLTALKAVALYELGSLLIYLIYPFPLLSRISNVSVLKILDVLIFGVILFFIFYFITKKILLISWKKSLISFLLVIVIVFPLLDSFRIIFAEKIVNFSVFAEESAKMEAEMKAYFEEYGFFGGLLYAPLIPPPPVPLAFKVIGTIEKATLSWPGNYLREIIIQTDSKSPEEKPEYKVPAEPIYNKERLPRFEDFPVSEKFEGTPAQIDFSSDSVGFKIFKDKLPFGAWKEVIAEGVKEGPNFAGHYRVFKVSCGTMCQIGIIINLKTGVIYDLPTSALGMEFHNNSSLFIVNLPPAEIYGQIINTTYYIWENNQFVEIFDTIISE